MNQGSCGLSWLSALANNLNIYFEVFYDVLIYFNCISINSLTPTSTTAVQNNRQDWHSLHDIRCKMCCKRKWHYHSICCFHVRPLILEVTDSFSGHQDLQLCLTNSKFYKRFFFLNSGNSRSKEILYSTLLQKNILKMFHLSIWFLGGDPPFLDHMKKPQPLVNTFQLDAPKERKQHHSHSFRLKT